MLICAGRPNMKELSKVVSHTKEKVLPSANPMAMYSVKLDKIDYRVLEQITAGSSTNKQLSSKLNISLSTIQRRTRKLVEKGVVVTNDLRIDYDRLGYTRGLIHIYLSYGKIDKVGQMVANLKGVLWTEVHICNTDIVASLVYLDNRELLQIITDIKALDGVERVVWLEFVHNVYKQTTG
jgi:DNA-binding Lrp family transcriptional regulator